MGTSKESKLPPFLGWPCTSSPQAGTRSSFALLSCPDPDRCAGLPGSRHTCQPTAEGGMGSPLSSPCGTESLLQSGHLGHSPSLLQTAGVSRAHNSEAQRREGWTGGHTAARRSWAQTPDSAPHTAFLWAPEPPWPQFKETNLPLSGASQGLGWEMGRKSSL